MRGSTVTSTILLPVIDRASSHEYAKNTACLSNQSFRSMVAMIPFGNRNCWNYDGIKHGASRLVEQTREIAFSVWPARQS